MLKILTVEQTRQVEAAADKSGLTYATLMENAGQAMAQRIRQLLHGYHTAQVTILVGKGNNGGDGLVTARLLAAESSLEVHCYLLTKRDDDPLLQTAQTAGVAISNAADDPDFQNLRKQVRNAQVIVDALFGIGIRLPLRHNAVQILQVVHETLQTRRNAVPAARLVHPTQPNYHIPDIEFPYVLAVDCPSGMDCDRGELDPNTLVANETITFIAAKPGLLTFPGASAVGQLTVASIGVPATLPELANESTILADAELVYDWLPARPLNSHKGTYGKTLIIGGSSAYRGAVALAAAAAYRVGNGLVTVNAPTPIINSLAGQIREATWLSGIDQMPAAELQTVIQEFSAILLGPGWGQMLPAPEILNKILDGQPDSLPPMVIDADGLNLLAQQPDWWTLLPPNTIITPHPGEMARLTGLTTAAVQADRWRLAAEKALAWQIVLVLKGAHTLIAAPDSLVTALPFKTDALAKAGTGDVLAGVIVGLLAQGLAPYQAAVVGGYVHGLAGELAAHQQGTTRSVLASDVVNHLAQALMQIENQSFIEI